MARQLRFEYPGAVYHIMARGDGGKCICGVPNNRHCHWVRKEVRRLARPLRHEAAGAVWQVMALGDGGRMLKAEFIRPGACSCWAGSWSERRCAAWMSWIQQP